MKHYKDLTDAQKTAAIEKCLNQVIQSSIEIGLEFFPEELQEMAEAAVLKAEAMQTPWFTHEYLLDVPEIKEWYKAMAQLDAEEAIYPKPGEWAVYLPNDVWKASRRVLHGIAMVHKTLSEGEGIANAKLIAAAPDLLEACRLALKTYQEITTEGFEAGEDFAAREALAGAIWKATGEEV